MIAITIGMLLFATGVAAVGYWASRKLGSNKARPGTTQNQ